MYTDEQLLKLNSLGLIPGPGESADDFAKRADYCLHLKEHLSDELKTHLVPHQDDNPSTLVVPNIGLKTMYDIAPNWIPVFFSNYRLPFWHGGCAWIFQQTESSPTAALIQLRQSLREQSKYLYFYQRDELLMHELTHVARMTFNEPRYEEIFAYSVSKSWFRRWFGAIIQSSVESVIFILLLGLIVVFDIFLLAMSRPDAYALALWLKLIPIALIGYGIYRLWKRHRYLKACLAVLKDCLGDESKARAVAFRLKDVEIKEFSKMNAEQIREFANENSAKELRWHVILNAYFFFS